MMLFLIMAPFPVRSSELGYKILSVTEIRFFVPGKVNYQSFLNRLTGTWFKWVIAKAPWTATACVADLTLCILCIPPISFSQFSFDWGHEMSERENLNSGTAVPSLFLPRCMRTIPHAVQHCGNFISARGMWHFQRLPTPEWYFKHPPKSDEIPHPQPHFVANKRKAERLASS
jgi:hypothetical protein